MTSDGFLHLMLEAMRQGATYSAKFNARVMPSWNAKIIFLEQMDRVPPEFTCVEDVLEEGTRKGFWEMDFDDERGTDVVVMK
jgi:hypothetical protein